MHKSHVSEKNSFEIRVTQQNKRKSRNAQLCTAWQRYYREQIQISENYRHIKNGNPFN